MQAKSFSLGAQEYLLEAVAVRCGDDLTVVIGGGGETAIRGGKGKSSISVLSP